MKRTTKRFLSLLMAAFLLITMLASCAPGTSSAPSADSSSVAPSSTASSEPAKPEYPDVIKLAYVGPLSGGMTLYGTEHSYAIQMMAEEINAAGGIKSMGGAKLEFEFHDDKADPKETVIIANKIVTDDDVVATIGPFSTACGLAVKDIFNEAQMPLISASISNPDFAKDMDYCFTAYFTQNDGMKIYGSFLQENLPELKRVAVLYPNNEWGQTVYDALEENFPGLGIEIILSENYEIGTKDFRSQLSKFKSADADFIYLAGHIAESGPMVNQMAELEMGKPVVTSLLIQQEYIDIVGENGNGQLCFNFFSPSDDNSPMFEDYRSRYLARFDDILSVDGHIAVMGNMMLMLRDVLEDIGSRGVGTTPEELRQAITDTIPTMTYEGMCFNYSFQPNGQIIYETLVPCLLYDGKFVVWTRELWNQIYA